MAILDTQSQSVTILCPHCNETFKQDIKIEVYEPKIEIDLEAE